MSQNLYTIVEAVCDRFKLSPFEVMQRPLDEVLDVWVGAVISANKTNVKQGGSEREAAHEKERVYSWNATWH